MRKVPRETWLGWAMTAPVSVRVDAEMYLDKGYHSPRNADLLTGWDVFHQLTKHRGKMTPDEAVHLVEFCFTEPYGFDGNYETQQTWLDRSATAPDFIREALHALIHVEGDPYDLEHATLEGDWGIFDLVTGYVGRPTPEQVEELIYFCFGEADPSTRKGEK